MNKLLRRKKPFLPSPPITTKSSSLLHHHQPPHHHHHQYNHYSSSNKWWPTHLLTDLHTHSLRLFYSLKQIFFSSWDEPNTPMSTYKNSKSPGMAAWKMDADVANLTDHEPLFDPDLFLFFVFKNHLLAKYVEMVGNPALRERYGDFLGSSFEWPSEDEEENKACFSVDAIQGLEMIGMTFEVGQDGWLECGIYVEMQCYGKDERYRNAVFRVEKRFDTTRRVEVPERDVDDAELLRAMMRGWKLSSVPVVTLLD